MLPADTRVLADPEAVATEACHLISAAAAAASAPLAFKRPPDDDSPASAAGRSTPSRIAARRAVAFIDGYTAAINAAVPATNGAAIDVPESRA